MSAVIFGNVASIMLRVYQGSEEFHDRKAKVRDFIKFHGIPKNLAERVRDWLIAAHENGVNINDVTLFIIIYIQAPTVKSLHKKIEHVFV